MDQEKMVLMTYFPWFGWLFFILLPCSDG